MHLRLPAVALGALLLLGATAAHADGKTTLDVAEDTYVKRKKKAGPFGSEQVLLVKNVGSKDNTRKALVLFSGVDAGDPFDAHLDFDVAEWGGSSVAAFNVFGIDAYAGIDAGDACGGLIFGIEHAEYRDAGLTFLDDSSDGVKSSPCIFGNAPLGTLYMTSGDVNRTVSFSSEALEAYLRKVSTGWGGVALFLLTQTDKREETIALASREHPTLQPARLWWREGGALEIDDEAPENVANGTRHVEGSLRIPFGEGRYITLPGANVQITLQDRRIQSISGTVGYPQLPTDELFDRAGFNPLDAATPSLRIGYDLPSQFDFPDLDLDFPLPLSEGRRYFYLVADTGFTFEMMGIATFTPPLGMTVVFVFDPASETVFVLSGLKERTHDGSTDFKGPSGMLISPKQFAIGFSRDNRLEYRPIETAGMEDYLAGFVGDLYLSAAVEVQPAKSADDKVEVGAYFAGEMLINYEEERFADGNPTDAFRDLGINGLGSVEVDFQNVLEVSIPFARGSATVTRASNGVPLVAFNGKLMSNEEALDSMPALGSVADRLPSEATRFLPFGFGPGARVAGYIDPNQPMSSFVHFEGDMMPNFSLPNVRFNGDLRVGPGQVAFAGEARFPSGTFEVGGSLVGDVLTLYGEKHVKAGYMDWSLEFDIEPKIVVTRSSFSGDVSASVKACFEYPNPTLTNPGRMSKKCFDRSVSTPDFDLSTGQIRVCSPKISSGIPGIPDLPKTCKNVF